MVVFTDLFIGRSFEKELKRTVETDVVGLAAKFQQRRCFIASESVDDFFGLHTIRVVFPCECDVFAVAPVGKFVIAQPVDVFRIMPVFAVVETGGPFGDTAVVQDACIGKLFEGVVVQQMIRIVEVAFKDREAGQEKGSS